MKLDNITKRKSTHKVLLIVSISAVLMGLIVWGIYSLVEINNLNNPASRQAPTEEQIQKLLKKVEKHIVLPSGSPTVATVEDKDQLANEIFFVGAENGDKVLIFQDAGMAIIYRESDDRIVNSGPIMYLPGAESIDTSE